MSATTSITVHLPLSVRRQPGRKTIVTSDGQAYAPARTRADPALVKALARAFRWQRLLNEGRYASVSEIAAAERIERGYLGRVLRLTLLAPGIVEAVLNGRQGADLNLRRLLDCMPPVWSGQHCIAKPMPSTPPPARSGVDPFRAIPGPTRPVKGGHCS